MKKRRCSLLSALLCAAMLALPAAAAEEELVISPTPAPAAAAGELLEGKLERMEDGSLVLKDKTGEETVVHIPDGTPVVNAQSGAASAVSTIKAGDAVGVYVGPAMTLSLPPQYTAEVVLTNLPTETPAPLYRTVTAVDLVNAEGITVQTADGGSLSVSAKAEVKPYLTKNRVTYRDLIPGAKLLVWFDGTAADRVLLLSSGETPFTDVAQDHWAYQDILACASEGLLSGDQSLAFRPGEALTRAELVKALYHMAGCPAVIQSMPAFTDVKSGDYISALTWAVGNKLVSGYADNTFRPDAPVTRQQLAAFLYRWEQHRGGGFQGAWMFLLDYTDRDSISDYAYEGVAWCTMNGVLTGRSDGTLAPGAPVTRAAAAVMLQRYLGLQDAKN